MSYIDVLIPALVGVLLVAAPQIFVKPKGEAAEKTQRKLMLAGFALLGVAVVYLMLTISKR